MAKRYLFGKSFTFTFFPIDDKGNAISADSLVNAYVFTDANKPDRAAAIAGTNALQTIAAWSANGNGYDLTVAAIDDPDTSSDEYQRQYWISINFKLASGEQTQTALIELIMSRPVGYGEELNVTAAVLEKYYPAIDGFVSDTDQADIIEEAAEHVKGVLKSRNWEYWMVTEPGELRSAVIWRSLYQIALAELSEQEAGFSVLLEESKENYGNAMERLKVRLDTDLDGEPERPQNFGNYMRIMI
jgi:hypothetical protein